MPACRPMRAEHPRSISTSSVPVDLLNPGQVFACLGLMELAEVVCGGAEAGFDWSDPAGVRFSLRAAGDEDPVAAGLRFLAEAEVHALSPERPAQTTEKWGVATRLLPAGSPFPIPVPSSPATLPAELVRGPHRVVVSSWGDSTQPETLSTGRDNVKFWAGAGGYPGVALLRDALAALKPQLQGAQADPFALSAPQSSSFRFDWRRDYIPIDAGFSLNEHSHIQPRGYPAVEVLAAIGLSHARPKRIHKLWYRYGVAGRATCAQPTGTELLPPPLLRAALGLAPVPLPTRSFTVNLGWPGQENQARCITTVSEEYPT